MFTTVASEDTFHHQAIKYLHNKEKVRSLQKQYLDNKEAVKEIKTISEEYLKNIHL